MAHMEFSRVILKSLYRPPATRMYPIERRIPYAATRGSVVMEPEGCTFCTLCQIRCPASAIAVNRETKTWQIDRFKCVLCGACVSACVRKCLVMKPAYAQPAAAKSVVAYQQQPKFEPWLEEFLERIQDAAEETAAKH